MSPLGTNVKPPLKSAVFGNMGLCLDGVVVQGGLASRHGLAY